MAEIETEYDSRSLFFLFAPSFRSEAARVASSLAVQNSLQVVNGLYTGLDQGHKAIRRELDGLAGQIWSQQSLEFGWLEEAPGQNQIKSLERRYGPGFVGRLISADRRLGRGFVGNASVRPDPLQLKLKRAGSNSQETYALNLMSWVERLLVDSNPVYIFLYAVAGAPALALALAAERFEIPYGTLKHARIKSLYFLDYDFRGSGAAVSRQMALNEAKTISFGSVEPAEEAEEMAARQFISDFREKPEKPDYALGKPAAVKPAVKKIVLLARTSMSEEFGFEYWWWLARRKLFDFGCELRKTILQLFRSPNPLVDGPKYIYFPLHVDPEASTMVLSPDATNQLAVVETIAKALPPGYCLAVKEHLPMVGRRPRKFYQHLRGIPRVKLLDARLDGFDLVRSSEAVVTITGSAGQEALILGKPVVSLGPVPYANVKSGVFASEPKYSQLAETFDRALGSPGALEEDLVAYLTALLQISFPLDDDYIWGGRLSQAGASASRKALVEQIQKRAFGANKTTSNSGAHVS